jgi:hypothetical protein
MFVLLKSDRLHCSEEWNNGVEESALPESSAATDKVGLMTRPITQANHTTKNSFMVLFISCPSLLILLKYLTLKGVQPQFRPGIPSFQYSN